MQSQTKWFLRRGGAVYGPVEQTTLEEWARTGRIRPDDRISADGVTWSAPAEMEFLEMEWIVEPVGGRQVGPLNITALTEPVLNGTLAPETPVRNSRTGEELPLALAIIRALSQRGANPERVEPTSDELRRRLADAEAEVQRLREELQELRSSAAGVQGSDATTAAQERSSPPPPPAPPSPPGKAREKLESLFITEAAELRRLVEERNADVARLEQEVTRLQHELRREREQTQKVRGRLHELAQVHEDLLRSFRELHARMVGDQSATGSAAPPGESTAPARSGQARSKIRLL